MNNLFPKIIDKMFPSLDESLKHEIYEKVSIHMLEFLKEKVFADDLSGIKGTNDVLQIDDFSKRSEEYGKSIFEKFFSLPVSAQEDYLAAFDNEMTRVMRQIYSAAV